MTKSPTYLDIPCIKCGKPSKVIGRKLCGYHYNRFFMDKKSSEELDILRIKNNKRHLDRKYSGRIRKYNLLKHYGLTSDLYMEMQNAQENKCAICKCPAERDFQLYVDHNHDTKEVRGLLCNFCNVGLGIFKDSINRVKSALEYLEKYN